MNKQFWFGLVLGILPVFLLGAVINGYSHPRSRVFDVTTVAARVTDFKTDSACLRNTGSADIFIGDSNAVTTATGFPIEPGDVMCEFVNWFNVFAISAGSEELRIFGSVQ